MAFFPGPPG